MGYVDEEAIALRLGPTAYTQLTDDAGTGQADPRVVDEARRGAEGEVDSYLARRYRVPIDTARHPELAGLLASVALDLIEHRLHARRPPIPEAVAARQRGALDWLAKVSRGEVALPAATVVPANDAGGVVARALGNPALLSREELESL
jgi:phage gp36-like protein